jgi:hypothetical protein
MRDYIPVLIGIVLLLAACGGGDAPPTVSQPSPSAVANPTATAPARANVPRTSTVGAVIPPATGTITNAHCPCGHGGAGERHGARLPPAAPVAFGKAPWKVGERTSYAVTTRDGQQAGTATYTVGGEFEAATVSANLAIGATQDRYQIGFDGRTFAPASELRSIVTEQGTIDIRAEYHAGGATIEVIDRNGTVRNQLTLPQVYYANDQFLIILRALPFAEGYSGSLQLVPSQGTLTAIPTVVTVTGKETVTTPRGTIACWRVVADFEGATAQQILWYGVDAPNYLVKYETARYIYTLTGTP